VNPLTTSAPNIAIYCDYENVALGARDAKLDGFDIGLVIARLLDKGKVVVKKAYADWDRYKGDRRKLHEAAFELIEIPHVSYSGKNSADIRLVVDALDLCYTKSHVELFAIVSGDSDFSPLVSKLRENDKRVIGLGVKNSSSDLLIANCDEFIYYDDLVREKRATTESVARRGKAHEQTEAGRAKPRSPKAKDDDVEARRLEGLELVLETVESLFRDRDDDLWGSMVKQTIKRKRPTFSESFHGYRSFNALLEDAEERGMLKIEKDERSGGYRITSFGPHA
jgi:uncharacterized protein (TIGR00288 family)